MRILHFFKTYWPDSFGGIERTIHALSKGAFERGVDVEVLSLSSAPQQTDMVFDGHKASKAHLALELASTGFSFDVMAKFRAAATAADVVHYHFPWPFMDLTHLIVRHGKPSLVTYHSDVVKQKALNLLYAPLRNHFLSDVDEIIATSPNYTATSPILKKFAGKTSVIPLGLDEVDYPKPDNDRLVLWRSKLPRPFFLFAGEFRYYKGLDALIDAAPSTNADIVLIGAGRLESELRQQVNDRGATNVHFVGRLDDHDKAALLTLALGFVFPSNQRSEAFGLSLVEAAIFGRPMISCEIGTGTSYVNLDGETGIIVPPFDSGALADAMNRIAEDTELRQRLGQAARQRYKTNFTARAMVDLYMTIYQRLAGR